MTKTRRIGVIIDTFRGYGRDILQGIAEYARLQKGWSLDMPERYIMDSALAWLKEWRGDGIIARIEDRRVADAVARRRIPCIELAGFLPETSGPLFETNHRAVSQLAFNHLRERGLRNFAYCGFTGFAFSEERADSFVQLVEAAGGSCPVYRSNNSQSLAYETKELGRWLGDLPKPVGVMACNDLSGRQVISACQLAEIDVPFQIAVIGVDNDEMICRLAHPPLSSVIPDAPRIGFEGAAALDKLMQGKRVPKKTTSFPPLGVATRLSTDVLAFEDPSIAAALRKIRTHACDPLSVRELVAQLPLSLSMFERRFRNLVGHSPKKEITRVQIERAKELLRETDLPLTQIAAQAGFANAGYFCMVFKKEISQTPGQFRASRSILTRRE